MTYPPSLLERVQRESDDLHRALSGPALPSESLPLAKQASERRLLAMTGTALEVLDDGMSSGPMKDRLPFASKVLELSPATRQQPQGAFGSAGLALPDAAMRQMVEGLHALFEGLAALSSPTPFEKEVLIEAPDQSSRPA